MTPTTDSRPENVSGPYPPGLPDDPASRITAALIYPAFLAVGTVVLLHLLAILLVPLFEATYARLEARGELPALTKMVIGYTRFVQTRGWAVHLGLAALALGFRLWARSPGGRRAVD